MRSGASRTVRGRARLCSGRTGGRLPRSAGTAVNGLLRSSAPAESQATTTFTYDGLGRLTGVDSPQNGAATRTCHLTTGLLVLESNAVTTTTYDY